MTVAPVSASTAIHNGANPNGAEIRNASFVISAIATFCRTTRMARRACRTSNAIARSSVQLRGPRARARRPAGFNTTIGLIDDGGLSAGNGDAGSARPGAWRTGPGGALEHRAALHQHAASCRRAQRGDHRHRRRDHQRARAREHEKHQRAIEPDRPLAVHERRHDGDHHRARR